MSTKSIEFMKDYPTNLTDSQWNTMLVIFDDKRKRNHSLREIMNAIFYLLKTGCQWRMLPNDYPNWKLVYYYFSKWRDDGTFEEMNDILRGKVRKQYGKHISPSLAIIDSQSVKTTRSGGVERGIDGGKKVKGRKRHIITDTKGLLLSVKVHAANEHDSKKGYEVINSLNYRFERMETVLADGGYRGELGDNVKLNFGWNFEISMRNDKAAKFEVLPKRWIVERTFSWFENFRRLAKDYEFLPSTSESMIYIAFIMLMINKIIS